MCLFIYLFICIFCSLLKLSISSNGEGNECVVKKFFVSTLQDYTGLEKLYSEKGEGDRENGQQAERRKFVSKHEE